MISSVKYQAVSLEQFLSKLEGKVMFAPLIDTIVLSNGSLRKWFFCDLQTNQIQMRDISTMALSSVKQAFLLNLKTDAKATNFTNDDLVQILSDPKVNKLSVCLAQYSNNSHH